MLGQGAGNSPKKEEGKGGEGGRTLSNLLPIPPRYLLRHLLQFQPEMALKYHCLKTLCNDEFNEIVLTSFYVLIMQIVQFTVYTTGRICRNFAIFPIML